MTFIDLEEIQGLACIFMQLCEYVPHLPSGLGVAKERRELLLSDDRQERFQLFPFPERFSLSLHRRYPNCHCINFGSWFLMSFPAAVIILLLSWIWLQWLFLGFK